VICEHLWQLPFVDNNHVILIYIPMRSTDGGPSHQNGNFPSSSRSMLSTGTSSGTAGTVISACQYLIFQVWIVTDKSSQSACGIYGREHNPLGMFENVAVADRGRSCITPYSTFLSRPPSVRPCARQLSRSCLRTSTARGSSPRPAPKVRLPLPVARV